MPSFPSRSYVGHYAKEPSAIPDVYNGMRVEALDSDNQLLFVADVQVLAEDRVELVRTSELFVSDLQTPMHVNIRGFNPFKNWGIRLEGEMSSIARGQDKAWLVKNVVNLGKDTTRSFSRKPLVASGWVKPADSSKDDWIPCQVVNASSGGVCIRCTEAYASGDKLTIRFKLRRDKEQPPLSIAIRRVTEREDQYEYGCEFVDLSPEVDTIIIRTNIELQNMQ